MGRGGVGEKKGGTQKEWGRRNGEEEPFLSGMLPEDISLSVGSPTSVSKENSSWTCLDTCLIDDSRSCQVNQY